MRPDFNRVKTIFLCTIQGIRRCPTAKLLGAILLIVPLFGFVANDIDLTGSAKELFLEYQFGFQKWFLLIAGLALLNSLVGNDQNIGTQSALRAAGVQHIDYILGKFLSILLCLGLLYFVHSLYGWALSGIWPETQESPYSGLGFFLMNGWLAVGGSMVITSAAYLIWKATNQQTLGFFAAIVIWIAGTSKPVWEAFFLNDEQIWVFKGFGWILKLIIPSLFRFDLWLVLEESMIKNMNLHVFLTSLQALLFLSVILFASWKVAQIKRT